MQDRYSVNRKEQPMLFGKKKDAQLENLIQAIRVDLSNNYKDNAVSGIKKFRSLLEEKKAAGKLKEKDAASYEELLSHFEEDVKNFKRTY